jgi:nucleoid-associated protein YgaU
MLKEEEMMLGNRGRIVGSTQLLFMLVVVLAGCAGTLPQEVTDVNRALSEAKDACAGVYAPGDLDGVQGKVDSMNALADDKKYKKARKAAEPILPEVNDLQSTAAQARESAKAEAESALEAAGAALDEARGAQAETYVATAYGKASSKLDEARRLSEDPCKYREAKAAADEAARLAGNAREAAVAEKRRIEEEEARKRAEEEARKRAEEEARRLEEERLKRFPTTYVVERGDSLWRISGMDTIYDDPVFWPIVYDANGGLISDPDLIYPGQELQIPRGMSEDEMGGKLKRLWRRLGQAGAEEE